MSETTVVKGQFGLDQSGGTGKKLKYFILQMSSCYKPTFYNTQGKQNQWINDIHCTHDLWCSCDHTIKHLLLALAEKEEIIPVTTEQKRSILKCLSTTEDLITETVDKGDIDELALDAIFAEDLTEDTG